MLIEICKDCKTKLATHGEVCEYCNLKAEMIYIASKYAHKGYDYETLCYGDDLNGREHLADEVWEYVVEAKETGEIAFKEKYKEYKLYF